MKLDGKTAIVTGAGRGIGQATALKLAGDGARVVVNDLDPGPAKETVELIEASGGAAVAAPGDIIDRGFTDTLVEAALDSYGGLDIVVNNAGYTWDSVIQKTSDEQWEAMLGIHLTAPFRMLRSAAPFIREAAKREAAEGRPVTRKVVNVSSIAGTGRQRGPVWVRRGQGGRDRADQNDCQGVGTLTGDGERGGLRTDPDPVNRRGGRRQFRRFASRTATSRSASASTCWKRWSRVSRSVEPARRRTPLTRSTSSASPSRTTSPAKWWSVAAALSFENPVTASSRNRWG